MNQVFETYKPQNSIVQQYVDYYYLDIKPDNINNEFQCFPHYNNTISIYKSNIQLENKDLVFDKNAEPFQIFTPVREQILTVKQVGKVHRIVIVFQPFGVQQFFRGLDFSDYVISEFFSEEELQQLFSKEKNDILALMDEFLEKRFIEFNQPIIEKSLQYIFNHYDDFSVTKISKELGISRQHLNRVFKSYLGVSVKKFHEIFVFRQTMNKRLNNNSVQSLTELAYEFNFSDQSHLNKIYKKLTEHSPKSFFAKGTRLGTKDTFWHLKS